MKLKVLVPVFILSSSLLFSAPVVTEWKTEPNPAFVGEKVRVSCELLPGPTEKIDSWEGFIVEDSEVLLSKKGLGGGYGESVVASMNWTSSPNPGEKTYRLNIQWSDKFHPEWDTDPATYERFLKNKRDMEVDIIKVLFIEKILLLSIFAAMLKMLVESVLQRKNEAKRIRRRHIRKKTHAGGA